MQDYQVLPIPRRRRGLVVASRWTAAALFALVLACLFFAPVYRTYHDLTPQAETMTLADSLLLPERSASGLPLADGPLRDQARGVLATALVGLLAALAARRALRPSAAALGLLAALLGCVALVSPLFRSSQVRLFDLCEQMQMLAVVFICERHRPLLWFWLALVLLVLAGVSCALLHVSARRTRAGEGL